MLTHQKCKSAASSEANLIHTIQHSFNGRSPRVTVSAEHKTQHAPLTTTVKLRLCQNPQCTVVTIYLSYETITGGRKAVTLLAAAVSQDGIGRSVPCSVAKLAGGPLIFPPPNVLQM